MKTILGIMKKRKNGIPDAILQVFENIVHTYSGQECFGKYMQAVEKHFNQEQRFRIWEQYGGCMGTGHDKKRKSFAVECSGQPLSEKVNKYIDTFENGFCGNTRNIVYDEESGTITVTFSCDECYRHIKKGHITAPLNIQYEYCAGGRLYSLEKALDIKLKIESVDVSPLGISVDTPCVFVFKVNETVQNI
jgi:hypothetical protein